MLITESDREAAVAETIDVRAKKAVVDTSALIKAPLDEICKFSDTIYTVEEVIHELRDKKTTHKMKFVPNYLKLLTPNEESYKLVCDFAKKAGTYSVLSVTDLKVIALTHQLHVEVFGHESIKKEPTQRIVISQRKKPEESNDNDPEMVINKNDSKIPGFFDPREAGDVNKDEKLENEKSQCEKNEEMFDGIRRSESGNEFVDCILESEKLDLDPDGSEDEDECESDSDSNDGWITTSNLKAAQKKMEKLHFGDPDLKVWEEVACITLDYAMQNVLAQMGMSVMSVDGVKMSSMKSYVLRCYSCSSKTHNLSKVFCPNCGSKTLKRLFYSLDADGSMIYHYSKNYVLNTRGQRYHVTRTEGGKHGRNPWIAEDQRFPRNQAPKKHKLKNLPLDPDYMANSGPFTTRDTQSRFFNVGFRCAKDPHENKGGSGTRRKKIKP